MPVITIEAGKTRLIQTPAKYLNVIKVSGQIDMHAPEFGTLIAKSGRVFVLDTVTQVELENSTLDEVEIELEVANIEIRGSGGGAVSVENSVTVKRIEEAIAVSAEATVENGSMSIWSSNVLEAVGNVSIPAGQVAQIVPARNQIARRVDMQVISDEITTLHIGSDNTINADKGLIVRGSIDVIGSGTISTSSAIWAYNDSDSTATVAVVEQYRA